VLSLALWGVLLYFGMQPLIDYVRALFGSTAAGPAAACVMFGLGMLRRGGAAGGDAVLLPLILTSLVFMGLAAMPAIGRHVGTRQFPRLEMKHGGSLAGSLALNMGTMLLFVLLWLLTLPLYLLPPVALVVQVALWGWMTARVMSYDVLAAHASEAERRALVRAHRRPLLAIGMVSGAAGALPGIVWIGGALISVVLFPLLAMISVWLYLVIFVFTGLWFQYYCLQALQDMRAAHTAAARP
jgi:hypothetical protein